MSVGGPYSRAFGNALAAALLALGLSYAPPTIPGSWKHLQPVVAFVEGR